MPSNVALWTDASIGTSVCRDDREAFATRPRTLGSPYGRGRTVNRVAAAERPEVNDEAPA
jgi:hypothetical protein